MSGSYAELYAVIIILLILLCIVFVLLLISLKKRRKQQCDTDLALAEMNKLSKRSIEQQKQLEKAVIERTAELRSRNRTLNKINEDIIELFGNITEARDVTSGEHIRRVKGFTNILASAVMVKLPEYNLTPEAIELMTSASALHDIGKIMISDAILLKPGKLTSEEFEIMKTHCVKGCELLKKAPRDWSSSYLKVSMDICRHHHERYDGKGYPDGLVGDEIPISAQIVAIADCFDALITKRVYKDAYSLDKAFQMILDGECGAFSQRLLDTFSFCRGEIYHHATDISSSYDSAMPAGISSSSLAGIRILYADDMPLNLEIGAEILQAEGAEVTMVPGGREAIDAFNASPNGFYDAILMDVVMPDIDGIQATAAIRAMSRSDASTVAIIALTSLTSESDLTKCLTAGMDSFISKPISSTAFSKVLFECLQSRTEALDSVITQMNREAAERIDEEIQRERFLTGADSEYAFICYVNGSNNDVSGFRCDDTIGSVFNSISPQLPPNRRFDQLFRTIVPAKDFKKFIEDVNRDKILGLIKGIDSRVVFVPVSIHGVESIYKLRITADFKYAGNYIISLQRIDAQTQAEVRMRQLIHTLSGSYIILDYIDFEADSFSRYQSSRNISPDSVFVGCYSDEVNNYIESCVIDEDRETVRDFLNPATVLKKLRSNKSISVRFRSIKTGMPKYHEFQFINVGDTETSKIALLTLSEIDEMARRELLSSELLAETLSQLEVAERKANRDGLTGVKNISAYTDFIAKLTERLNNRKDFSFGVVVCDINNLKEVNDSFGHAFGDEYIRNSCRIICNQFKHSPVFRTGGDEFAVMLLGQDLKNRDSLLSELRAKERAASQITGFDQGRASFASGMAVYDPSADESIADVVQRADADMYRYKRSFTI